jgi:hypothetical protein
MHGALIVGVQPGGPAATARLIGNKAAGGLYYGGDVIVSLDANPIPDTDTLTSELAEHKPGDVVDLGIVRCGGIQRTIPVTLGAGSSAVPNTASSTSSASAPATTSNGAATAASDATYPNCYIGNANNVQAAEKKLPKSCSQPSGR